MQAVLPNEKRWEERCAASTVPGLQPDLIWWIPGPSEQRGVSGQRRAGGVWSPRLQSSELPACSSCWKWRERPLLLSPLV